MLSVSLLEIQGECQLIRSAQGGSSKTGKVPHCQCLPLHLNTQHKIHSLAQ